jgi:signal transduction histidine kinase
MQPHVPVIPRMYSAPSVVGCAPYPVSGTIRCMGPSWAAWLIAALAAACAAGLALALARARRLHRTASQDRSMLLDRERENAARTAVDAERARIATELHDIVSHNVSLMVVQVSAAREVLGAALPGASMPPDADRALGAVEDAGRGALTELRHLLGLLAPSASGEDAPDLSPQPSCPSRYGSPVSRGHCQPAST